MTENKNDVKMMLDLLSKNVPLAVQDSFDAQGKKIGLIIIDAVNGFCTPGMGNLAPRGADPRIDLAISKIDRMAHNILSIGGKVLTERDIHSEDTPEYPYPAHCVRGTGEELLVPELQWLNGVPGVTDSAKHCINALVGTMRFGGGNGVIEWIVSNQIEIPIIVGFCTDICVLEYALTLMSVKNMRQLQMMQNVVAIPDACATYDLPIEVALEIGVPALAHPAEIFHHMALTMMQKSGIILAEDIAVSLP